MSPHLDDPLVVRNGQDVEAGGLHHGGYQAPQRFRVAAGQEFPIGGVVGQEAGGLHYPLNLAPVFRQHQPGHQFHPLAVPLQDLPGGQVLDHQEQAHQGHQQG